MDSQKWTDLLDYNIEGKLIMSDRFFGYKSSVVDLEKIVEDQFNNMMRDIMEGLPDVQEALEEDGVDFTFDGTNVGTHWTCRTCHVKNVQANEKCTTCKSDKPKLTAMAVGINKPVVKKPANGKVIKVIRK